MQILDSTKVLLLVFLGLFAVDAYGCCDEEHFYQVTNVKAGDYLNVRKYPHQKAPIVGKTGPDSKDLLTIVESSHIEQIECIKQALNDPNINKTFADPENEQLVKPYRPVMVPAPGESGASKGTWCRVSVAGSVGWVNATFLKYSCSETIGETGGRHPCIKSAAKKTGKPK